MCQQHVGLLLCNVLATYWPLNSQHDDRAWFTQIHISSRLPSEAQADTAIYDSATSSTGLTEPRILTHTLR